MVKVLAFDTATSACSVAIWRDGQILAFQKEIRKRGHAERLFPMIEQVLADAGCAYDDFDLLAVTVGPGAFTGIRIGLAAARSLALASGLPLLGVGSFEAVAHSIDKKERGDRYVFVALETKRADVYGQMFAGDLSPVGAPLAVLPEALTDILPELTQGGPALIAGDAGHRVMPVLTASSGDFKLGEADPYPDPATIAAIALERWRLGAKKGASFAAPEPFYLRPPDVNLPDNR